MTDPRSLYTTLSQQALSLVLAVAVTASVLAGVVGLAASDQSALMAAQAPSAHHAVAMATAKPAA